MTIEDKLKRLLAKKLRIEPNTIDSNIKLNSVPDWDSLAHINIIIELNTEFGLEINPENVQNLTSFDKILVALENNN